MRLDWKAVLGIVVTILLLWWALHGVPFSEVWARIREGDLVILSAAAVAGGLTLLIRAFRWHVLLRPLAPRTSLRSRFGAVSIGFMANNVLPWRVGEFARAYALSRLEPVSASGAFGTLVVERALDGVVLLALLLAATAWPTFPGGEDIEAGPLGTAITGATVLAVLIVGSMLLLLVFPRPFVRVTKALSVYLPNTIARLLVDVLEAFLEALAILKRPGLLLLAVVWTVALWLFNALYFWLGFRAFDIGLDYVAAVFTEAVVGFGVALPSAPGFIGTFHYAADLALSGVYGVPEPRALAYAFGLHIAGWIPVTALGLWYAWRMGLGLREVGRSEEEVELSIEHAAASESVDRDWDGNPAASSRSGPAVPRSVATAVQIEAPAKVNLVLKVLGRSRLSEYHDLETVLQAIDLADHLRIEGSEGSGITLEVVGMNLGPPRENLAWKAARAFTEAVGVTDGLVLRLEKVVPAGAGLGGGSSDAAATLLALNALYGEPLEASDLRRLGASLGSDVPFFLVDGPTALAWGRGDRVRTLPTLPSRPVLLVVPETATSTRDAYAALARIREENRHVPDEAEFEATSGIDWDWVASRATNDFETVIDVGSDCARARAALARTNPMLTLLAGSGSAVFAVYAADGDAEAGKEQLEAEGWHVVRTRTLSGLPRAVVELARDR